MKREIVDLKILYTAVFGLKLKVKYPQPRIMYKFN